MLCHLGDASATVLMIRPRSCRRCARAFLFNAKPHDPVVYVGVAAVLLAAGLAAAFGPARRATRLDPLVALRQD